MSTFDVKYDEFILDPKAISAEEFEAFCTEQLNDVVAENHRNINRGRGIFGSLGEYSKSYKEAIRRANGTSSANPFRQGVSGSRGQSGSSGQRGLARPKPAKKKKGGYNRLKGKKESPVNLQVTGNLLNSISVSTVRKRGFHGAQSKFKGSKDGLSHAALAEWLEKHFGLFHGFTKEGKVRIERAWARLVNEKIKELVKIEKGK